MEILKIVDGAKAVLFDMDGIIIDSDSLHDQSKRGAVEFCGIRIEESEWQVLRHYTSSQIYQQIAGKYPDIKISEKEFVDCKSRIFLEIAPEKMESIPGALEFVQYLKNRGIKTALVTASRLDTYGIASDKFNLGAYFDVVITREDVGKSKPDPEAYLKAAQLLKVSPKDCVVFEDAVPGVQSGKSAGCKVIGRSSTVSKKILLEAGVEAVFEKYSEIAI